MKYISLADNKKHKLTFYLAMEEYVAKHLNVSEAFFMWQVEPTVICGRNQIIEKEVNLTYCRNNNIQVYRRKSGGGCVYADMGNIMLSYITNTYNVADAYSCYLSKIVYALKELGIESQSTGRNDIAISNGKISGNAFYHINKKSVVHGTMLYDTNMEYMVNSITPSEIKLKSKSVDSVRSRIATIKEVSDISIYDLKNGLRQYLCCDEIILSSNDIKEIELIEKEYITDEFIWGRNPRYSFEKDVHIEGVGCFKVVLDIDKGVIKNLNLFGDYFVNEEIDTQLLNHLKNIPYNETSIRLAIKDLEISDFIVNLDNEKFIKLIIN